MLSLRLSMHRTSLRQTPATAFACTGAQGGNPCGFARDAVKGYEWINLEFASHDPGGGPGT